MIVTEDNLDAFVAESDRLGGPTNPACTAYWEGFSYQSRVHVDQSLDPFSEQYVDQQMALHSELSGRRFDQHANEQTELDVGTHLAATNPYNHPFPGAVALHLERLNRAFRLANVPRGGHLIDMGCGWGLSSEIGAYLGLTVTAVDINPDFVDLVNRRAARFGWPITATVDTFDDFTPQAPADMVLFYECLHHAVRPWTVVRRLADAVKDDGCLVLAGEPVNALWWTHWGLRLDALSVYCVRKFGWFESGWSLPFIRDVFDRCGLAFRVVEDTDPDLGFFIIGRPMLTNISGGDFVRGTTSESVSHDGPWGVITGSGWFDLNFPPNTNRARIQLQSFRPRPVGIMMAVESHVIINQFVPGGLTVVEVARTADSVRVRFEAGVWNPSEELGSSDARTMSIHIEAISYR